MHRRRGVIEFGIFTLLIEIGARMQNRGEFRRDDGTILTCLDFEAITGADRRTFEAAIKTLCLPEFGWLELVAVSEDKPAVPVERDDMREEENRLDKKRIDNSVAPAPQPSKKPRDARIDEPIIQVVRDILGKYPNKSIWDDIVKVGEKNFDEGRLRYCGKEWAKVSGNMFNLTVWLFDWYPNGIPRRGNGTGRNDSHSSNDRGDDSGRLQKPTPVISSET